MTELLECAAFTCFSHNFSNCRAETADNVVVFNCDDTACIHNSLYDSFFIDGFDCVHIKNTNLKTVVLIKELCCFPSLEYA